MLLRMVLVTALAGLGATPAAIPTPQDPTEQETAREGELRRLMALTDGVTAGGPLGGDLALAFEPHFLKGGEGQTYVPFSLWIDEHTRRPSAFVVYVRVAAAGQAPPSGEGRPGGMELAAANLPPGELPVGGVATRHRRSAPYGEASARLGLVDKDREAAAGPYVFEDSHVVEVDPRDPLHPYRIQRALAVPPGDYVVYVAVSEVADAANAGKSAVVRLPLLAPDFRGGGIRLSSLILADEVRALPAAMGTRLHARRPYAVGSMEIVPASGRELAPDEEPAVAFQIYGAELRGGRRPKVGIEYLLLRRVEDSYLPHARLPSQLLDERTLPAGFDPASGHQLGAVQHLPVSLLPPGEYLLEIKVTDHLGATSARGALDFAVRPR